MLEIQQQQQQRPPPLPATMTAAKGRSKKNNNNNRADDHDDIAMSEYPKYEFRPPTNEELNGFPTSPLNQIRVASPRKRGLADLRPTEIIKPYSIYNNHKKLKSLNGIQSKVPLGGKRKYSDTMIRAPPLPRVPNTPLAPHDLILLEVKRQHRPPMPLRSNISDWIKLTVDSMSQREWADLAVMRKKRANEVRRRVHISAFI